MTVPLLPSGTKSSSSLVSLGETKKGMNFGSVPGRRLEILNLLNILRAASVWVKK